MTIHTKLSPRELDAALARQLFGWRKPSELGRCDVCGWPAVKNAKNGCTPDNCSMRPSPETRADEPTDYSTAGDGMLLVMLKLGGCKLWHIRSGEHAGRWGASFPGHWKYLAYADAAPRAVALAALATMEVSYERR